MSTIITVESLAKRYEIASKGAHQYNTLREAVGPALTNIAKALLLQRGAGANKGRQDFWALKDVSFDIREGEVVGVIGRNGAGKSTLLKILSRITSPTSGRVRIVGRLASLLEVGTGFHPELTGRENVFLNGAILGMARREISRKLPEIVAFSGVEKFLDTPVKRYSSGMYMRLAFSVAAHLEPEILVVDEVLAVGDFEFQNKCLKKMESVAGNGRTVLFVSHNMSAVQRICSRAILLEAGQIKMDAAPGPVIDAFLQSGTEDSGENIWAPESAPAFDDGAVRLRAIRSLDIKGAVRAAFSIFEPIVIEVEYEVLYERHSLNTHLYFSDSSGQNIFVAMDGENFSWGKNPQPVGLYKLRVVVPGNLLNEGRLNVEYLVCCRPHTGRHVSVTKALNFQIIDDRSEVGARGGWQGEWPSSVVRPLLQWSANYSPTIR